MPQIIEIINDSDGNFVSARYVGSFHNFACNRVEFCYPTNLRVHGNPANTPYPRYIDLDASAVVIFSLDGGELIHTHYYTSIKNEKLKLFCETVYKITIELGDVISQVAINKERETDDIEYNPEVSEDDLSEMLNICEENIKCHK